MITYMKPSLSSQIPDKSQSSGFSPIEKRIYNTLCPLGLPLQYDPVNSPVLETVIMVPTYMVWNYNQTRSFIGDHAAHSDLPITPSKLKIENCVLSLNVTTRRATATHLVRQHYWKGSSFEDEPTLKNNNNSNKSLLHISCTVTTSKLCLRAVQQPHQSMKLRRT